MPVCLMSNTFKQSSCETRPFIDSIAVEQHRHFVALAEDWFGRNGGPTVLVTILIIDGGIVAANLNPVINTTLVLSSLLNVDIGKLQQDMFPRPSLECCLLHNIKGVRGTSERLLEGD